MRADSPGGIKVSSKVVQFHAATVQEETLELQGEARETSKKNYPKPRRVSPARAAH